MNAAAETLLATPLRDAHAPEATAPGWAWAAARCIGPRHQAVGGRCEDAVGGGALADGTLALAVADGVSGGARGDIAAQALVEHALNPPGLAAVQGWMQDETEARVRGALQCHTDSPGATTFAAVWLKPGGAGVCTRVGDCRAYLWQRAPDGRVELRQLLPDQTLAYMGYVPPKHPKAGNPAHMAGNGNLGRLEWAELAVPSGGGLLLCSDGLHGVVPDTELAACLQTLPPGPAGEAVLAALCQTLIDLAQVLGGDDDVSLLLAQHHDFQGDATP